MRSGRWHNIKSPVLQHKKNTLRHVGPTWWFWETARSYVGCVIRLFLRTGGGRLRVDRPQHRSNSRGVRCRQSWPRRRRQEVMVISVWFLICNVLPPGQFSRLPICFDRSKSLSSKKTRNIWSHGRTRYATGSRKYIRKWRCGTLGSELCKPRVLFPWPQYGHSSCACNKNTEWTLNFFYEFPFSGCMAQTPQDTWWNILTNFCIWKASK